MSNLPLAPPFAFAGEVASLSAALMWSISITIFTKFGDRISPPMLNLYKNLVAITCLIIAFLWFMPEVPLTPMTWITLGVSGIIGLAIGDTALFASLNRLGAQVASTAQCLSPVLSALLALIFLQEYLTWYETLGMTMTVGATCAVITFGGRSKARLADNPRRVLLIGVGYTLIAALCQALAVVLIRQALQTTDVLTGTVIRVFPAIIVLTVMAYLRHGRISMRDIFQSRRTGFAVTFAAFIGTFIGLLLMSFGAKYAKAGVTASLTATYPIWIIPLAKFVLKEEVNWRGTLFTIFAVAGIGVMLVFS